MAMGCVAETAPNCSDPRWFAHAQNGRIHAQTGPRCRPASVPAFALLAISACTGPCILRASSLCSSTEVRSALYPFWGEGSPTKIDYKKKSWYPYSKLSNLEDLVVELPLIMVSFDHAHHCPIGQNSGWCSSPTAATPRRERLVRQGSEGSHPERFHVTRIWLWLKKRNSKMEPWSPW